MSSSQPSTQASVQPLTEQQLVELSGKTVVNAQGEELGEIDSIVRDRNDQSLKAIITSGGFFGMGGEKVAVAAEELQLQGEDKVQLSTPMTKDELQQAASQFNEGDYEAVELQTQSAQAQGQSGSSSMQSQGGGSSQQSGSTQSPSSSGSTQ